MTTFWVEPYEKGGVVEVDYREGEVVITTNGLKAVNSRSTSIKVCDSCDTCSGKRAPGCKESDQPYYWWELVDLQTQRGVSLVGSAHGLSPASQGCAGQLRGYQPLVDFTAIGSLISWDATLILVNCDGLMPSEVANVVSADTGATIPVPLPAPDVERMKKRAAQALLDPNREGCRVDPLAVPSLFASSYSYNAKGRLIGTYDWRMSNLSPCQGPRPYFSHVDIVDLALPAAVEPWRRLPSWLIDYSNYHGLAGVSPVTADQDLARLKKLFAMPIAGEAGARKPDKPTSGASKRSTPKIDNNPQSQGKTSAHQ